MSLPAEGGHDIERTAVRVVLRDSSGAVFLFRAIDPTMPESGTWWELPGGGVESGESAVDTAVREVLEETGFRIDPGRVSAPRWHREVTYRRRLRRYLQHEAVVEAALDGAAPTPSDRGQTATERLEYVAHRWWHPDDLAASPARFFPGRLPELLAPFLAGEAIIEPFEQWS